jgi:hypothetical protein
MITGITIHLDINLYSIVGMFLSVIGLSIDIIKVPDLPDEKPTGKLRFPGKLVQ